MNVRNVGFAVMPILFPHKLVKKKKQKQKTVFFSQNKDPIHPCLETLLSCHDTPGPPAEEGKWRKWFFLSF